LGIEPSEILEKAFIAFIFGFGLVEFLELLSVFLLELLESWSVSSILGRFS
jgi:hypothetical protein